MAIRRKLTFILVELRAQKRNRFPLRCPVHGQHPDVTSGLRINLGIDDEPAITGPLSGLFEMVTRDQQLVLSCPARRFLIEIHVSAAATRSEYHAVACGRPERRSVNRTLGR